MLYDTAPIELEDICDRCRRTSLCILSQVYPASVVINSSVEYRVIRDRKQPGETVNGLIQRAGRSRRRVFNITCAEMVGQCSFNVFGVEELLNKFIEDRDLLSGRCRPGGAVACSRCHGQQRENNVELHSSKAKRSV